SDKWLHLARYHDIDRDTAGAGAFCKALLLAPGQVFPISFDLQKNVIGEASLLKSAILLDPRERLSRGQLIGLAASRLCPRTTPILPLMLVCISAHIVLSTRPQWLTVICDSVVPARYPRCVAQACLAKSTLSLGCERTCRICCSVRPSH